jgi:FkbM family methyltransferase
MTQRTSPSKSEPMQVSANIVGPFKRNDRAYIDERALLATLLVSQTKTGVMIDVGAMRGLALSPFCQAGWQVFAFEPDPTNRKELETRFGNNPNLIIDGRAVADRIAENMPFYSSPESAGISSLHPFRKSHEETCKVSTTTIADFVREKGLHHIDYLKIDAEGYDLLVLKGVHWDSIKPKVIMCEFEDSRTKSLGYTMHDMAHYLTERGYIVLVSEWHPVIRYGTKQDWHRLVLYPCELDDPNAGGNLIAFHGQPDLQEIATIARRIVKVDAEPAHVQSKVALKGDVKVTGLRDRGLYQRLIDYLNIRYPAIITVGRFVKWSLAMLKNTILGIGGIAVLVIAGLYIAGALIEPARWYLVGVASALLLLSGGLLMLFYARSVLNHLIIDQRQLQATVDKLEKHALVKMQKEISDSKDTLAKMNVGNFPLFQQLNRRLTNEDLKRFAGEWAPKLGLNLDARALAYIAHRICLAEDTCVGYLAGNIETMLLRVLVARSVQETKLDVLEIGTLFGVGVAMIHESCMGLFSSMHFTVIDPLIGLIGRHDRSPLDTLTKAPVTREIFIHNMQRMNIPKSDYIIIERLSTEDEAIEQASKRHFNLLIIDGDHSYFGVKHDFNNYRHLVKRGGYIIFDDYGNPRWPGLKNFVDKEVAKMPELEFVGTDVFTAVFRVITTQD